LLKNEDEFVDAIKKYDGQLNIYVGINEERLVVIKTMI